MLLKFSDNIPKQIAGIAYNNRRDIIAYTLISTIAAAQYELDGWYENGGLTLPVTPITILGSAIAIFLGFRNNSAYDRWWEARKVWGGIVNASRTLSSFIMTFPSPRHGDVSVEDINQWKSSVIRRQISWLYALKFHLRRQNQWEKLTEHMSQKEHDELMKKSNKPAQLLHNQNQAMAYAYETGMIDNFRHLELARLIKDFYDYQGKCERIKNTVFPYYYNYFTNVFLWVFIILLPFSLVEQMGWAVIPMCVAISFIFRILDKSGALTEDPFEGRAADTPMSTITRSIEIDLLEMLGNETPPKPLEVQRNNFDASYMD